MPVNVPQSNFGIIYTPMQFVLVFFLNFTKPKLHGFVLAKSNLPIEFTPALQLSWLPLYETLIKTY